MPEQVPQKLKDLPPTAKLVYKILEYEGKLTQQELCEETFLAQRTVYNALRDLEEIGAIDSYPNPEDLRQTMYFICSK
ncbi:MarR family winged helix-turn-helix transcriptional regulator [Natrinema sp. DC36]|uniref:MarR family winged helix-turn-helix transcriptional regulator n=1 Tax=Natrinema sp. DC36 TaxID=2878680 RepID=UPI001CEFC4FC|nr:MarR family winged helix-turn-helix transcriptional regulator [Natrinema sp. DC36]